MKKIFSLFTALLLLSGCVESMAFLGHTTTAAGTAASSGNIARSAFSSTVGFGVKQQTGKFPTGHAMSYFSKNKPSEKKEKCVSFLEATNSEICAVVKKNISEAKKKIVQKSKIKLLNTQK